MTSPPQKSSSAPDSPSSATRTLTMALAERSYQIHIGTGVLSTGALDRLLSPHLRHSRVVLVTNETLWPLYGKALVEHLTAAHFTVLPIILPDGESFKDGATLNVIYDTLLEHAVDRKTTMLALGGGVIGDIAGYAAATYQRGIPFVQIPTTLLAQVDSSVGGKTAINHPRGKNMIGAFYQPQLVLADTDTLKTLPKREYRSGLAEIIKYGLILDEPFFTWLETNIDALLNRDACALAYAIYRSCEIKARVVAADERETAKEGGRALLNLGHTFGHAIETALGYGEWLHGEAVACGMLLAVQLSQERGHLTPADVSRTRQLLERTELPISIPFHPKKINAEIMLKHMSRDKKNEAGVIKLILLRSIGEAYVDSTIHAETIETFLKSQMSA